MKKLLKLWKKIKNLKIKFFEYSNLLKKLFDSCIKQPQLFNSVFIMQKDGTAKLNFEQNIQFKRVELLSIDFVNSPDDMVKKQISYRYNIIRTKLELSLNRIQSINNIIKNKNPSLLLQIQKSPTKLNLTTKTGTSSIK